MRAPLALRRFAPTLGATLVMLAGVALLVSLGLWQLRRADEQRRAFADFADAAATPVPLALAPGAAPPRRYARVEVRGRYLTEHQVLLDNIVHDNLAGYRVLTPFEAADGVVLVDRGWLAAGATRRVLPPVAVGGDARVVTGRLGDLPRAGLAVGQAPATSWPRVLNYPTHAELEAVLGRPVYPRLLLLDAAADDGFVRDWRPGGFEPEHYVGYALQWFAFAATLFAGWIYLGFRPRKA